MQGSGSLIQIVWPILEQNMGAIATAFTILGSLYDYAKMLSEEIKDVKVDQYSLVSGNLTRHKLFLLASEVAHHPNEFGNDPGGDPLLVPASNLVKSKTSARNSKRSRSSSARKSETSR